MYVNSFMGRPFAYWEALDDVMRKHNVVNAVALDERLSRKPAPDRVEVYDVVNAERLLGTLPKPVMDSPYIKMLAHERLSCPSISDMVSASVSTISLLAQIKRTGPLDAKGVLTTSDPLKELMKVRDFRLPGESEEQAERRRYW